MKYTVRQHPQLLVPRRWSHDADPSEVAICKYVVSTSRGTAADTCGLAERLFPWRAQIRPLHTHTDVERLVGQFLVHWGMETVELCRIVRIGPHLDRPAQTFCDLYVVERLVGGPYSGDRRFRVEDVAEWRSEEGFKHPLPLETRDLIEARERVYYFHPTLLCHWPTRLCLIEVEAGHE